MADGKCKCSAGWVGVECAVLDLVPLGTNPGGKKDINKSTGRAISSWGGSVVFDPARSEYSMYAAEMAAGCGIDAWLSNSVIVHSTSKDPAGLYKRQGLVWGVFSHEPVVVRAPTGELVMYFTTTNYLGVGEDLYPYSNREPAVPGGLSGFCHCHEGSGGTDARCQGLGRNWSVPLPTYMSWTANPFGNWSFPVAVPVVQQSPLIDSNLSPIILKNGSLLALWRNDDDRGSIHVATARDWREPSSYVQHTGSIFKGGQLEGVEDPYVSKCAMLTLHAFHTLDLTAHKLWQSADGNFHLLVHGECGFHAFSIDGFNWETSPAGATTCVSANTCYSFFSQKLNFCTNKAFPRVGVKQEGGGVIDFARRERPVRNASPAKG